MTTAQSSKTDTYFVASILVETVLHACQQLDAKKAPGRTCALFGPNIEKLLYGATCGAISPGRWFERRCAANFAEKNEQLLRSSRRNVSPVELIDGPFLMRHEHVAGTLVERREIAPTSSRANGVLHHPPEAFNGIEVVATMGR